MGRFTAGLFGREKVIKMILQGRAVFGVELGGGVDFNLLKWV